MTRVRLLGVPVLWAVACANPTQPAATESSATIEAETLDPEEAKLLSALRAVLPAGVTVDRTAKDVAPQEWYTDDGPGLFVQGSAPGGEFRIWFVPEDWVGIRKVDPDRARTTYWEGILLGRGYKSLTLGPIAVQEAVRKLGMQTPSIVNSGWNDAERIWDGRFAEADRKALALIGRHAQDRASFSEAAHALVVLGVPARSVFVRAATQAQGDGRELALSALGYFSSPEVTAALGRAVADRTCTGRCRKMAAMALERVADPASGPALTTALARTVDAEAATRIALALARINYRKSGAAILTRMEYEDNVHYKAEYARALATLRHKAAIPALAKLAGGQIFSARWALDVRARTVPGRDVGMSLLRLTGAWSQPVDGIRILLLAPETRDGDLAILIENQSDAMVMVPALLSGRLIADGVSHERQPMGWDGVASLHVGGVWIAALRLADFGVDKARAIRYEVGGLRSNTISM